jgi:hypothetical protein
MLRGAQRNKQEFCPQEQKRKLLNIYYVLKELCIRRENNVFKWQLIHGAKIHSRA